MADSAFTEAVLGEAADFGLAIGPSIVAQFKEHYDLLVAWNRKLNLTRIVESLEAARFHFLESALLSRYIENPAGGVGRVVDVGSGAGFPGLPLACVWPDCEFVLVEPNGKRAVFLKEVIRRLGLARVKVDNSRFAADKMRSEDVLVTRALEGLDRELEAIVRCGARVVALYSEPAMIERARRLSSDRTLELVEIPGSNNRRIGVLTHDAHTREAY